MLLKLSGLIAGLSSGVGLYYVFVQQKMDDLHERTIDRLAAMEKALRAASK